MIVYDYLLKTKLTRGAGFLMLLDPDRVEIEDLPSLVESSAESGVDAFLVGTSLLTSDNTSHVFAVIKRYCDIPAVLFPGNWMQVSPEADAILYLSLISGRNPDYLISEQVKGAPMVKAYGIESIPTGYMLISSGSATSVAYISDTQPIPRDKPDIAKVHALAGEYLGMKLIYLEAGSGARESVPDDMIGEVASYITRPLVVGGGIETPEEANAKVVAGSSFVVIGTKFEQERSPVLMAEFSDAIHIRESAEVKK